MTTADPIINPTPLPLAYSDPQSYLCSRRFHRTLLFRPSCISDSDPPHRITYATVGSDSPSAPVLVLIHGLGAHRLAALFHDGYAADKHVRVITVDRPFAGGSTPVPLEQRVQWSHEALLAVLAKEGVTTFGLHSHSNGIIYALYTLLHLPAHLTVTSWTATSPFVPPSLSGSSPLTLAQWIPAAATSHFGAIVGLGFRIGGSLGRLGTLSSSIGGDSGAEAGSSGSPERDFAKRNAKNAERATEKRTFAPRYYSAACADLNSTWVQAEGFAGVGQEALLSLLKGGRRDAVWGWDSGSRLEDDGDDGGLYERGFKAIKARHGGLRFRVVYGTADGLIPRKGRAYLRDLLQTQLGLVAEGDWIELDGVGHDDVFTLDAVMGELLDVVVEEAEKAQRRSQIMQADV